MRKHPSRAAEFIVTLLTPPGYRETVVGDLHERYRSPTHYFADVLTTVPAVIWCRVRRTTRGELLLMESMLVFLSFMAAAFVLDRPAFLTGAPEYAVLSIPCATMILSWKLVDIYSVASSLTPLKHIQQGCLALGITLLVQGFLSYSNQDLRLPLSIMSAGGAAALILISTVRILFPTIDNRPRGVR